MAEKTPADASEEPSIEEILGSIRRIIAEEDDMVDVPPEMAEEPLELTNRIEPDGTVVQQQPVVTEEIVEEVAAFVEDAEPAPIETEEEAIIEPDVTAEKLAFQEEVAPMADMNDTTEDLISSTTAEATAAVLAKLTRRSAVTEEGHEGLTIEAIVREMLKPLLREWLDAHLPEIVQKVVERELERLSNRL